MNYFELFDIPIALYVEPELVRTKFYALSRRYHPDFYAQGTEAEQAEALEMASLVNKAFKTFQQPDETIRYVLQWKGLLEEEEKYQLDPEFLMEVMEINEELMEVDERAGLQKTREKALALQDRITAEAEPLIRGYNETGSSQAELLRVKDYYFRKKYIRRILDALDQREKSIA